MISPLFFVLGSDLKSLGDLLAAEADPLADLDLDIAGGIVEFVCYFYFNRSTLFDFLSLVVRRIVGAIIDKVALVQTNTVLVNVIERER